MRKILAIDDKQENLVFLETLLNHVMPEIVVITAQSGQEGLERAQSELPDVILLDIVMPDMDGFEVCTQLKTERMTEHIPIIMITAAEIGSQGRVKALNLGADAFVSKPIDSTELVAQIKAMLRIKRAEDILREEREVLERSIHERTKSLRNELEERMRVEETLQRELNLLLRLMETHPVGIVYITLEGKVMFANSRAEEVFGISFQKLSSQTFNKMDSKTEVHTIDVFSEKFSLHPLLNTGQPIHDLSLSWEKPDGTQVFLSVNATPIFDKSGNVEGMAVMVEDTTECKHNEEALRESEEFFRTLVENLGEGVGIVDPEERFIFGNPAAEKLFGVTPGGLVGRNLKEFLDAEQWARIQKETHKRQRGEISVYECEIIRPAQERRSLLVTATPRFDKNGQFSGTFGIFRDITERRQMEEHINASR